MIGLVVTAGGAFAQEGAGADEGVEVAAGPSEEQIELNDEAVRAIGDGDYTKAISYLEESLYLGEFNITYLNLGRANQLMGRCEKARAAFDNVFEAPHVEKPPADFVEAKAREYRDELDESCKQEDAAEGEGAPAVDQADVRPVQPDREATEATEAEPSAQSEQPADVEDSTSPTKLDAPGGQEARVDGGANMLGWVATAGGLALIGAGVGLHVHAESLRDDVSPKRAQFDEQGRVTNIKQSQVYENQSSANTFDTVGLSMGIVGGLGAAAGVYLLLTADEDEPAVTIGPRTDAAGFMVNGRF